MSAVMRHWDDGVDLRTFSEKCMDGFIGLSDAGFSADECEILAYHPGVESNPFQKMLYSRAMQFGVAPIAVTQLSELENVPSGLKLSVHFHWIHQIFSKIGTEKKAEAAAEKFLADAKALKSNGARIIWTIHNVISHGSHYEAVEMKLRAQFAELADVIHVMNPRTAALCAPYYMLDTHKLLEVPHPSYAGVYGDYISKSQARLELGLPAGKPVFLLFGSLMPQKGTRQFLHGMDELQKHFDGEAIALVAGKARLGNFYEEILRLASSRVDVKLMAGHVDDQHIQMLFKASDVVVCPYIKGLNSGVVMTAASFGRPVVAPSFIKPTLHEIEDAITEFDPADFSSSYTACTEAYKLGQKPQLEEQLLRWADANAAHAISEQFFSELKERS
ncbi:glycosyltransferase [Kordiimonas sp. SCSIO 12603]|uniref:glycosyltransferase n=1 Tax=Kordiimonas sp. SCSIO 12603 TaxID=2829596 RepID=UPI002107627D|nr:glycosyltransferase [Kordiimonas sp. SCSIO 12603]UTW60059.1 glycosyltransferase [Kordiimonas sp. SCSIO 12603]